MAGIPGKWQSANQPQELKKVEDIYDIVDSAFQAGELWCDAASIHQRYKEGEKNAFSKIRNAVKSNPLPAGKKAWTQQEIDDAAYSHADWEKYLNEWNEAYKMMLKARNNYDAWVNKLEAARSKMATDRLLHKVM